MIFNQYGEYGINDASEKGDVDVLEWLKKYSEDKSSFGKSGEDSGMEDALTWSQLTKNTVQTLR